MAYLPKRFLPHQIFAANTDVGKTIFSTALCRGVAARYPNSSIYYLKPVQTGYPVDSDARHAKKFCPRITAADTLYTYKDPVSPHIATTTPPSDVSVLQSVRTKIEEYAKESKGKDAFMFLETAGGVNSPVMSGTLQCNFYRPLRLPTLLVADSKLGGISTTLSSFESLHVRGYDVNTVLLFEDDSWKNNEFLAKQLPEDIRVFSIPSPPARQPNRDDTMEMSQYYAQIDEVFKNVAEHLKDRSDERITRLMEMEAKTKDVIWWPFTQHHNVKNVTVIDSACGDMMVTLDPKAKDSKEDSNLFNEKFDGCASWWTQGLGHGSPSLSMATAHAAGRYGHVIAPECTNELSLSLAEKLVGTVGKGWAQRVYYSDNGSTATEIALKMALRHTANKHQLSSSAEKSEDIEIIGLKGSYHGDTIGAMDACDPNVYNGTIHWYQPRGFWFDPPTVSMKNGVYNIHVPESFKCSSVGETNFSSLSGVFGDRSKSALADFYRSYIDKTLDGLIKQGRRFGALMMEPILMGAGGMIFVDPLFQKSLVEAARDLRYTDTSDKGIPVILDEVFTGFWRLGRRSAAEILGVKPDIAAYAKLLTGGLVPLAVTLTSEEIFKSFYSPNKHEALLHGHSYTAHPIGCSVALQSIKEYEQKYTSQLTLPSHTLNELSDRDWYIWNPETVKHISHLPNVQGVVSLGTVLAIELKDTEGAGYTSNVSKEFIQHIRNIDDSIQVFARPLGNVVYVMGSIVTTPEQVKQLENTILSALKL
ncbi:PLP-dependent transferase [Basidiobolus meristosporus CBS 931.73]|uniref:PLP-dependent transferase n=1 Tax=Basidiobolus meristosporus CBS 931.73 TaxID=1314790 RepID=A0A1Y1YCR8_9FUNG|nr:PLP-dependent transferase [Basidiobolus meristosporus CBS 931.73]|eukprot:ORX95777.1 PLP-dependent transferase [Basidiobolus meristosporus CBS 931.73]